jgi:DNA repair exonuclease SbcCD nuclease subunit
MVDKTPNAVGRVLLFSDLHIHPHKRKTERLEDCLKVLEWVFDTAIERGIENILFGGDLFHDRQKIDVLTYQRTFEIFDKKISEWRKGNGEAKIWLLLGNHDLWHLKKHDVSSVYPLAAIDGVEIISEPCTRTICSNSEGEEFQVSFLPYTHNPPEDLGKIENKSENKVLVGHIAIDNAVWNRLHGTRSEVSIEHDGDMIKVDTKIFDGWNQVFLGHYHAEQQLDFNTEYIGSPLQLSFGEAFQHKHIVQFDLKNNDKEYIRNTFSPQHFIIPEADLEKYVLDNNFIRVLVEDISDSKTIEMRQKLTEDNDVGSLEIQQSSKKKEEHIVEDAKAILFKEEEMLDQYVDEVEKGSGLDTLEKEHLLEIGKNILQSE